jgi:hypothetical protein
MLDEDAGTQEGHVRQSSQLGELATALSKFQGLVTGSHKGGKGNYGAYTRLEDVWAAIREPLSSCGLSVTQWTGSREKGRVSVTTRILHASGQWLQGTCTVDVDSGARMNATQQYGSAFSYCQRYALLPALGLPPVDDDGAKASAGKGQPGRSTKRQTTQRKSDAPPTQLEASKQILSSGTLDELKDAWREIYQHRVSYAPAVWAQLEQDKELTKAALTTGAADDVGDEPAWMNT